MTWIMVQKIRPPSLPGRPIKQQIHQFASLPFQLLSLLQKLFFFAKYQYLLLTCKFRAPIRLLEFASILSGFKTAALINIKGI